jgi:hypothetical protein
VTGPRDAGAWAVSWVETSLEQSSSAVAVLLGVVVLVEVLDGTISLPDQIQSDIRAL